MPEIKHASIGANVRKVEITEEEKSVRVKKIIDRFVETPWKRYGIDQLSVWMIWGTLAVSAFLYCTVSAVMLALR